MNGAEGQMMPKEQKVIDNILGIISQSKEMAHKIQQHLGLLGPNPGGSGEPISDLKERISAVLGSSRELFSDLEVINDYLQTL